MKKVIAIGLDGFEPSIAQDMMGEGLLPFFSQISEQAACFDLDHGDARYTGLAWEHFSTGRAPDNYQRWSSVSFDRDTYSIAQQATRQAPFTAALDTRVLAFDVPYHELASDNVVGIANWGAHDPGIFAHSCPHDLEAEIARKFGPYPAKDFIYGFVWPSKERTAEMASRLVEAARLRGKIAEWLTTKRLPDWELALIVFSEFHSGLEALWHGWDSSHPLHNAPSAEPARQGIRDLYIEVDSTLARLAGRFPDAIFSLFSPHGMGPNKGDLASMALLPELLYRHNFLRSHLRPIPKAGGNNSLNLLAPNDWSQSVLPFVGPPPSKGLRSKIAKIRRIWESRPSATSIADIEMPLDWMPATRYQRFWPRMAAFALPSFYDGRVRINLAGRERNGMVTLSGYERELDRMEILLRELRDLATGDPVVSDISRPVADDPHNAHDSQCDIRIEWRGICTGFRHPDIGEIGPIPYRRTGGHTGGYGFAAFHRSSLPAGHYGVRSTFDFVPTLVEMLGYQNSRDLALSGSSLLS
ncbi:hypothetical protein [Mesorhizobium sp. 10J20-29]